MRLADPTSTTYFAPPTPAPTLSAVQAAADPRSYTDSKIGEDLLKSTLFSSASMSPQGSFRLAATDLKGKVSGFPSPDDGIFTLPDQDMTLAGLLCSKINELPKTPFFNPLKLNADLMYGNIECLPPKKMKESLDHRLNQLFKEGRIVKEQTVNYCKTIEQFFKDQTLPCFTEFENIKSDFKRLEAEFADVQIWFKRELEPLRARVQRGEGAPLTEKQIDSFAYKLRSVLPREVIDACCKESDSKHQTRKKLLIKIELEWDSTCLTLQKIHDYICMVNSFLHVLPSLKSLKEESLTLSKEISALMESSFQAPYAKLDTQSCLIKSDTSLPAQKSLADSINYKESLNAKLLEFEKSKNLLLVAITQALSDSKLFIEGESCGGEAKEPRPATFLKFMALPKNSEVLEAKRNIIELSNEEMAEFSKMVVNQWNDISLDYLKAKQELLLAERVQDIYPQLEDIRRRVESITSDTRNVRKTEDNYFNAVKTFESLVRKFTKLSDGILNKNEYPVSRADSSFCNLGFRDLYEAVIEEIKSSAADLTTDNATSCNSSPEIPESIASKYQLLRYDAKTDSIASLKFQAICTRLVFKQNKVLKEIQKRNGDLKKDSFEKAILELDRTFFAHKHIEENKSTYFITPEVEKKLIDGKETYVENPIQIKDPRGAYSTETVAAGWKRAGYIHYQSPLA